MTVSRTGFTGLPPTIQSRELQALSSRLQRAVEIFRSTGFSSSLVDLINDYARECLGGEDWIQCYRQPLQQILQDLPIEELSCSGSLIAWLNENQENRASELSSLPLRSGLLEQVRSTTGLTLCLVEIVQLYAIDCFGREEWRQYYQVDVGSVPDLSQEFQRFWNSPDPIDSTQKVCDTHLPPVLLPGFVINLHNGKRRRYHLQTLNQLLRNRQISLPRRERLSRLPQCMARPVTGAHEWLVMRKGVIGRNLPFSMLKTFPAFLNLGTGAGYDQAPRVIDLATIVFALQSITGVRHLGDAGGAEGRSTLSYTIDEEEDANGDICRLCVGDYSSSGQLEIRPEIPSDACGIALVRRFLATGTEKATAEFQDC